MLETLTILPWWAYALIFTFLWPVHNEANRHFQVDGLALMIWRSFFLVLLFTPVLVIVPWPSQPEFYLFCLVSGLLFSYQEAEAFKLARIHGGLLLSLQAVVWVLTATIAWWLIDPASFLDILDNPLAAAAIAVGMVCGLWAQFVLRATALPEHLRTLNRIVLMAIAGGLAGVCSKLAMGHAADLFGAFIYCALLNVVIACAGLIRYWRMRQKDASIRLFDLRTIKAGLVVGVVLSLASPVLTLGYAKVPNPGFLHIATRLQDVWLYLYCRLTHRPVGMQIAGLILSALGAIAIIAGTQIIR